MYRQALLLGGLFFCLGNAACLRAGWGERASDAHSSSSDALSSDALSSDALSSDALSSDAGTFGSPSVLANVNGPSDDDWMPALSPDGLELYFASWRLGGKGMSDIWRATRSSPTAAFSAPAPVAELNSASYESFAWLATDGCTLVLTSQRDGYKQLYLATRASPTAAFSTPTKLSELASAAQDDDVGPVLVENGLRIYFSSMRPGGKGGLDIWMATRASTNSPFNAPAPVAALNTTAHDLIHTISPDGRELYFSSDRSGGVGKMDLYVVALSAPGVPNGPPVSLSMLNTAWDDVGAALTPDGLGLLFNRNTDLWNGAGVGAEDADVWIAHRNRVP